MKEVPCEILQGPLIEFCRSKTIIYNLGHKALQCFSTGLAWNK